MYCMPATNAALPSHKFGGLVGPLRPWSGTRRSCGGPPRPRPLPFARASRADAWTKTGACGRTVRTPRCNRICQATTMPFMHAANATDLRRRTGQTQSTGNGTGMENKIGTRVGRCDGREKQKGSNSIFVAPLPGGGDGRSLMTRDALAGCRARGSHSGHRSHTRKLTH
jgi:hypothetical protein